MSQLGFQLGWLPFKSLYNLIHFHTTLGDIGWDRLPQKHHLYNWCVLWCIQVYEQAIICLIPKTTMMSLSPPNKDTRCKAHLYDNSITLFLFERVRKLTSCTRENKHLRPEYALTLRGRSRGETKYNTCTTVSNNVRKCCLEMAQGRITHTQHAPLNNYTIWLQFEVPLGILVCYWLDQLAQKCQTSLLLGCR